MHIFAAEQIMVPDEFPKILKDFTKEVVRKGVSGEQDIVKFSLAYFEQLLRERGDAGPSSYEAVAAQSKKATQAQPLVIHNASKSVHDEYNMHGVLGDPLDSKARFATSRKTGKEKVIKEVSKAQISDMNNFVKKVQAFGSVQHPNVVKYDELFEDDYSYYLSSDFQKKGDLWNAV